LVQAVAAWNTPEQTAIAAPVSAFRSGGDSLAHNAATADPKFAMELVLAPDRKVNVDEEQAADTIAPGANSATGATGCFDPGLLWK
jgi:hypothetical protein